MKESELIAAHPVLYASIVAKAKEGLLSADDITAKVNEGVEAENKRILALDKLDTDMPGHGEMIKGFKGDRTITAEAAALQIIAAHGEKLKGITAAQKADAEKLVKVPGAGGGDNPNEGEKGFMALVADYVTEHKCKKSVAIKAIAASHTKEHAAFITEANKKEV